jgi:predicted anti-sigma-YlaC factor YlaD
MNCNEIKENLIFLAEGNLEPESEFQVRSHLKDCIECDAYYQKMKSVLAIIEKEKIKESNPYFSKKLMERMKSHTKNETDPIPFHLIKALKPVIAVCLVAMAIYTGIFLGRSYSQKNDISFNDSRANELQVLADDFYLNDFEMENIETILLTENNKKP